MLILPAILSPAGIEAKDVVIATAVSSGVGSILIGYFSNLPFVVFPGLGISAAVAGIVAKGDSLELALTASFMAGLFTLILTYVGATAKIAEAVPKCVKISTIMGMGLLIAFIGLRIVEIIVANTETLLNIGDLGGMNQILTLTGVLLTISLIYHKVQGAVLIGLVTMSILSWSIENTWPTDVLSLPLMAASLPTTITTHLNFTTLGTYKSWESIISLVFVMIFDISGIIFGLGSMCKITEPDGTVSGTAWAFGSSSISTMLGAGLGTTPAIIAIESAAGIGDGAKTGLSSIVCGLLFLFSVFFSPLFSEIPVAATAPVLIIVGWMMIAQAKEIKWDELTESLPAFLTMIMMPFTYSITVGIAFGVGASAALYVTTGKLFQDWGWIERENMPKGFKEEYTPISIANDM